MKIRNTRHRTIEELELELFKELPGLKLLQTDLKEKSRSLLTLLLSGYNNLVFMRTIKIDEGQVIAASTDFFTVLYDNSLNLKVGDFVASQYGGDFFRIEKEVLVEKYLVDCKNRLKKRKIMKDWKRSFEDYDVDEMLELSFETLKVHDVLTREHLEEGIANKVVIV